MKLFAKKNVAAEDTNVKAAGETAPKVKVLGGGAKCRELEEAVKEAMAELGIESVVEHVSDYAEIAACGVIGTPALMVEGSVVSCGRVLKKNEIKDILRKSVIE